MLGNHKDSATKGGSGSRKGEYKNLVEIRSYRDKVPQYMYIC